MEDDRQITTAEINQEEKPCSSSEDDGEWYCYGHNKSRRFRYKFCGLCGYRTFNRAMLVKHVELRHPATSNTMVIVGQSYPILLTFDQTMVDSTATSVPPIPQKNTTERQDLNGDDVSFFRALLEQNKGPQQNSSDVIKMNPSSSSKIAEEALLIPPQKQKKRRAKGKLLLCSLQCEHQTLNSVELASHENRHKKKSAHQCRYCSYSVHTARYLELHLSRDHPGISPQLSDGKELPALVHKITAPKTKNRIPRQPGFHRCTYCSHLVKKPESLKYHESLHVRKSTHPCPFCSFSVSTRNHLMKHLKTVHHDKHMQTDGDRVELMLEENLKIADDALKKTKLNRDACRNKIDELIRKKNEAEIDLRTRQCKALESELPLFSLQDGEMRAKIANLMSVKEWIEKCKNDVLKGINFDLQQLLKEDAYLSEALVEAEKSISQMKQILDSLKSKSRED